MIDILISSLIPSNNCSREAKEAIANNITTFATKVRTEDIPEQDKKIVETIIKYNINSGGGVLDYQMFSVIVGRLPLKVEEKAELLTRFNKYATNYSKVDSDKFKFYVQEFNNQKESEFIANYQVLAAQALETEWVDKKTKIVYKGAEGAKLLLSKAIFENPYNVYNEIHPGGDIRKDAQEMAEEYEIAKKGLDGKGKLYTGFREIDAVVGGHRPGELNMIGAFTGQGKSFMLANIAKNATFYQGLNGVIFTAETLRKTYRRRIICSLSNDPKLGKASGLESSKIKEGKLSPTDEIIYARLLNDVATNPDYGVLDIQQVPSNVTVQYCLSKAEEINKSVKLDYIMFDYLQLFMSKSKRSSRREEIEEILKDAKAGCLTFDNGRGIIGFAAHQIREEAYKRVTLDDSNFYQINDFSDTNEAGKSADTAVMIYRNPQLEQANELALKVVKNRDGETTDIFRLFERFETAYIGNLS